MLPTKPATASSRQRQAGAPAAVPALSSSRAEAYTTRTYSASCCSENSAVLSSAATSSCAACSAALPGTMENQLRGEQGGSRGGWLTCLLGRGQAGPLLPHRAAQQRSPSSTDLYCCSHCRALMDGLRMPLYCCCAAQKCLIFMPTAERLMLGSSGSATSQSSRSPSWPGGRGRREGGRRQSACRRNHVCRGGGGLPGRWKRSRSAAAAPAAAAAGAT
jgi:hypothetical protein